jgi:hypothetical protein
LKFSDLRRNLPWKAPAAQIRLVQLRPAQRRS